MFVVFENEIYLYVYSRFSQTHKFRSIGIREAFTVTKVVSSNPTGGTFF